MSDSLDDEDYTSSKRNSLCHMTNNVFAAFCIVIRALRLSCAAPNAVTFTAVCCGT